MVIVNKILNVLIFLLAIASCIAAVLLHQRRLELRSRADFMAATMVKVADAIDGGEGTTTDINSKDVITEEYLGWQRAIERHGMPGLRTTRIQQYRN